MTASEFCYLRGNHAPARKELFLFRIHDDQMIHLVGFPASSMRCVVVLVEVVVAVVNSALSCLEQLGGEMCDGKLQQKLLLPGESVVWRAVCVDKGPLAVVCDVERTAAVDDDDVADSCDDDVDPFDGTTVVAACDRQWDDVGDDYGVEAFHMKESQHSHNPEKKACYSMHFHFVEGRKTPKECGCCLMNAAQRRLGQPKWTKRRCYY